MERKKRLAWAELKVGVFVVVALTLLLFLALQTAWGGKLFTRQGHFYAKTYLPSVERLKPGAPVWLTGLEIGRVVGITPIPFGEKGVFDRNQRILSEIQALKKEIENLDPKQPDYYERRAELNDRIRDKKPELRTVAVTMKIENQYKDRLGEDSEVNIGSQGLIAESYIDISIGSFGRPPKKIWDEKLKQEVFLIEGVRTPGFREILTGANDVIANFGVLSDRVKVFLNQIDVENIGKTIGGISSALDQSLRSANVAFNEGTKLVREMRTGEGSLPKFINDAELYNSLSNSAKTIDEVTAKLKNGNGSLSKLINDPTMYDHANVILGRIDKGEGTLGRLSKDEAIYERTSVALDNMADILERLNQGEGSAGRFLNDPTLYDNSTQTIMELKKLVADIRKNPKQFLRFNFNLIKLF